MTFKFFNIKVKVWVYEGPAAWHFVTIDKKTSREIRRFETYPKRGFGSIPVNVTIGKTSWKTSVFPEKKGTYVLPIKKKVRESEEISAGDIVDIKLEVLE